MNDNVNDSLCYDDTKLPPRAANAEAYVAGAAGAGAGTGATEQEHVLQNNKSNSKMATSTMQQQQQHHGPWASNNLIDPQQSERVLADELRSMKFQDLEVINEEIHGVRERCPPDTPELIERSLQQLEIELNALPSKPAYDEAIRLGSRYVQSEKYRLKFLRCNCWNVRDAAFHMERNLSFLKNYFGTDNLLRPILLSDFTKEELECFRRGVYQILPTRDTIGRRVCIRLRDEYERQSIRPESSARQHMYIVQAVSDDILTQRLGVVFIITHYDLPSLRYSPEQHQVASELQSSIPVAISAVHLLLPKSEAISSMRSMRRALILTIIQTQLRTRTRFHDGTPLEWQYALASYGISKESLPMTSSGTIKCKTHLKWMALRRDKEKSMIEGRSFYGVECPGKLDILFRRGGNLNSHSGNQMLRQILLSRYEYYRARKTQEEKTKVAWSIVDELEQKGGRFLVECKEGYWVQLKDRNSIREKISNSMRDIRKTAHGKNVIQNSNSSTSQFLNQDHRSDIGVCNNKRQRTDSDMLCSLFS